GVEASAHRPLHQKEKAKDGREANSLLSLGGGEPLEKRRILLIDDSEITLAMEKSVLEARGYEVVATSTLMEFEKTLQRWRPDLILTDIHMPEAKGTDICRTLKNEYGTQDI